MAGSVVNLPYLTLRGDENHVSAITWGTNNEVEPAVETEKIQIKLATTSNKKEQRQDAKNNAKLYAKWRKTTWKTFEENIRRGRNRFMKA